MCPEDEKFKQNAIPAAVLVEGKFHFSDKNRASKIQIDSLAAQGGQFRSESKDNKIIIVADGDIVLNDFTRDEAGRPIPLPTGWNKYTYEQILKAIGVGKTIYTCSQSRILA